MRISDWSSDVCSSDLHQVTALVHRNPTPVDPAQIARPGQGRTIDAQRGHRSFESFLLEADAAHCLIDGREAPYRLLAWTGSAEGGQSRWKRLGLDQPPNGTGPLRHRQPHPPTKR